MIGTIVNSLFKNATPCEVESYKITLDMLSTAKSTFVILGGSLSFAVSSVYYFFIRYDHNSAFYIGKIVDSKFDPSTNKTTLTTSDLFCLFDLPVMLASTASGIYLPSEIKTLVDSTVTNSYDSLINISTWFSVSNSVTDPTRSSSTNYGSQRSVLLSKLLRESADVYDLRYYFTMEAVSGTPGAYSVVFHIGKRKGNLAIDSVSLSSSLISNVSINNTNSDAVNKVTFYPSEANKTYTETHSYYLLTDGTVTTNSSHSLRPKRVVEEAETFGVDDYQNLYGLALAKMITSKYSTEISFRIRSGNGNGGIDNVNGSLFVGKYLYVYPGSSFLGLSNGMLLSIVTKLTFDGSDYVDVNCGYHRSKLTELIRNVSGK